MTLSVIALMTFIVFTNSDASCSGRKKYKTKINPKNKLLEQAARKKKMA